MAVFSCSRPAVEMESRCKPGVIMASTRSGGGVRLQSDGAQLLGYRGFLMVALLFVTATTFVVEDVHCSITTDALAPAPSPSTQPNVTFIQQEADALNAVFQIWSKQNPQFSTDANWSLEQHPCNNLTGAFEIATGNNFQGAWKGVGCTSEVQNRDDTSEHYLIFVSSLRILGSNSSGSLASDYPQYSFDGIIGQLPSEISNLTNLKYLEIANNPKLTGPVPVEIFQLRNLTTLDLNNNSLSGTLPSDEVDDAHCKLDEINLSNNNFSGNLRVSSQGTLFCSSLSYLYLYDNYLSGTVPSDKIDDAHCKLENIVLSNNNFSGSLRVSSQGTLFCSSLSRLYLDFNSLSGTLPSDQVDDAHCNLETIDLSNNNFSGNLRVSSQGTLFCSSLSYLRLSSNQLDGLRDFQDWNATQALKYLFMSSNNFTGPFPRDIFGMPSLRELDLNSNQLDGPIDFQDWNATQPLEHLDISSNNFTGQFPREIFGMPSLQYLDLSMNNFFGSVDFGGLNTSIPLRYLYINNNNFNGTFSTNAYFDPSILDLSNNQFNDIKFSNTFPNGSSYEPSLQKIYFQNNTLKGQFPAHTLTAPRLEILNASQNYYQTLELPNVKSENSNVSQVFITNNKLQQDSVKYAKTGPFTICNLEYLNSLFLGGNPMCNKIKNQVLSKTCRFNASDPPLPVVQKSNTKMKVIIAISTSSIFAFILLVTTIYVWHLMGRIKGLHIILEEFEKKEVKPNLYSYREIKLATNNFNKDNRLGKGGFGVVFKGELFDGTQAAVKKLTLTSNQVLTEFLNEVIVISGLKHRNLVKLKGCCLGDGDQRILVLEYVENKNLAEALWINDDLQNNIELPSLDWKTRLNIIVGIARGLAYLHEELQPPIIHRDIKATNILLDKNYNPKIADFGLAYLFPALDREASHLTLTQVAGTRGYCAPEYALNGHLSTALDVYSFGILVLEIVSGRKNIPHHLPSGEFCLREWAWKQYKAEATMTLIDAKMEHSPSDLDAIMRVIVVALACVHFKAARRPKMQNVLSMLVENKPISEFQRGFEDGEAITEVCTKLSFTLDTTSSLCNNENLEVDDCWLLNNIGDIEMNSIDR